jgi:hypothetical protein
MMAGAFALAGVGMYFGGSFGASVGWLIGSWIFGGQSKKKNQIFDPGAQELPRPNQALRGTTMPVLFGTNRCPSQIVWQNNFQTIRSESKESSGGGGKGGGSGFGKSQKSKTTNVSYTYKLDLIYHIGMVPEGYQLYGAWIGADRMAEGTIAAIAQQWASSLIFSGNNSVTGASLEYDEAVYFPGNLDEENQWAHFTSVVGEPVRWPRTSWVGFKALVLGSNPSIPQISWEIGPGGVQFEFDPSFTNVMASGGSSFGNYMASAPSQWSPGYQFVTTRGGLVVGRRKSSNSNAWTISESDFASEVAARFPGVTIDGNFNYAVINDRYFMTTVYDIGVVSSSNWYFGLWELPDTETGTPVCRSVIRYQANSLAQQLNSIRGIGIAGLGTDDDAILIFGINSISLSRDPKIWQFPSINTWLDSDGETLATGGSFPILDLTSLFGDYFGQELSAHYVETFAFFLPHVEISGGQPTIKTRIYFHISNDSILGNHSNSSGFTNAWIENNLFNAGIPAAIVYCDLGVVEDGLNGANSIRNKAVPSAVIDNNCIVDTEGNPIFPFSDIAKNRDGTNASSFADYINVHVQHIREGEAEGGYLVTFCKCYEGSQNASPAGSWYKGRIMIYNPFTAKFIQYAEGEGPVVDTVSQLGAAENDRYNLTFGSVGIFADIAKNELYCYGSVTALSFNPFFISKFGNLNVNGGADVTPPYIIKQILIHPEFGIYPGRDELIDDTTYQLANQYCFANNILVSTQYRREEDWKDHVELLLAVYGGMLTWSGGKFKFLLFKDSNDSVFGASVRTIDNHHLLIDQPGQPPVTIVRGALQDTCNKVRINYIDRDLDYVQNQVEVADEVDQDLNGVRMREFPAQFVMSQRTALLMAYRTLMTNLYARDSYQFKLGPKDHDLEPGDVITIVDSHYPDLANGVRARIVRWEEVERLKFNVVAQAEPNLYLTLASSMANQSDPSSLQIVGPSLPPLFTTVYELPQEFQGADAKLYLGWAPQGNAYGATLYVSADGDSFAPALTTSPYPIAGKLYTSLGSDISRVFDEDVEIILHPSSGWTANSPVYEFNETLNEVSIEAMHYGSGLLWCGSEMLAYEGVTLVAQNHYRLSRVYRGWGGTHIHAHNSGDYFVKHGTGIMEQTFNEDRIGTTFWYKVVPFNISGAEYNVSSIAAQSYVIQGRYYRPQIAPTPWLVDSAGGSRVREFKFNVGSEIDLTFNWRDSARMSGYGFQGFGKSANGYGSFVSDTLSHAWRVEIVGSGDTVVRSTVVGTPAFTYTSSDNFADNGAWRGRLGIRLTPFNHYGDATRTAVATADVFF